ncbi:hypothetical protein M0802_000383 [Mischocyttarus mexicanus]|nr:hypothetical protein M0802_000383 [Mischocyttarus mexicanus]
MKIIEHNGKFERNDWLQFAKIKQQEVPGISCGFSNGKRVTTYGMRIRQNRNDDYSLLVNGKNTSNECLLLFLPKGRGTFHGKAFCSPKRDTRWTIRTALNASTDV